MTRARRFWLHPLTLLLTWLLLTTAMVLGWTLLLMRGGYAMGLGPFVLRSLSPLLPTLIAFWVVVRLIERRRLTEAGFGLRHLPGLVPGALVGAAAGGVVLLLLAVAGWFRFTAPALIAQPLLWGLVQTLPAALTEELVMRGLFLRTLAARYGIFPAALLTVLLYGVMAQVTIGKNLPAAGLAAAGSAALFCALYLWSRNLWLVIGAHWAWSQVAGILLGAVAAGPAWLTGGGAGPQAGLVSLLVTGPAAWWCFRRAAARAARAGGNDLKPAV